MQRRAQFRWISSITLLAVTTPAWATFAEIPEPNILALFGIGAAGAILLARYLKEK